MSAQPELAAAGGRLSGKAARAIEASLELAAERAEDITATVYARLFREQPGVKEMFCLDADNSVKGSMLHHAIEVVLDMIGEQHFAAGFLQAEAINHAGYDVPNDVFASFFQVLGDTIRDALGEAWSAEMGQAWQQLVRGLRAVVDDANTAPGMAAAVQDARSIDQVSQR